MDPGQSQIDSRKQENNGPEVRQNGSKIQDENTPQEKSQNGGAAIQHSIISGRFKSGRSHDPRTPFPRVPKSVEKTPKRLKLDMCVLPWHITLAEAF
jgi:hypothetical protein